MISVYWSKGLIILQWEVEKSNSEGKMSPRKCILLSQWPATEEDSQQAANDEAKIKARHILMVSPSTQQ